MLRASFHLTKKSKGTLPMIFLFILIFIPSSHASMRALKSTKSTDEFPVQQLMAALAKIESNQQRMEAKLYAMDAKLSKLQSNQAMIQGGLTTMQTSQKTLEAGLASIKKGDGISMATQALPSLLNIETNVVDILNKVDQSSKEYKLLDDSFNDMIDRMNSLKSCTNASTIVVNNCTNLNNTIPLPINSTIVVNNCTNLNNTIPLPINETELELSSSAQFSIYTYHACAIFSSKVQCVGDNTNGKLGHDPSSLEKTSTPVDLVIPTFSSSPVKVSVGKGHTCILMTDGTVFCYGINRYGQLGTDEFPDGKLHYFYYSPIQVMKGRSFLNNVIDIESGADHTCAILKSGLLYCWGLDRNKRLDFRKEENINVTRLALSDEDTCIVLSSNTTEVKCVGRYFHNKVFPMGQNIVQLTAGTRHFCALLQDSTAKCFGENGDFQLGHGSSTNVYDPPAQFVLDVEDRKPLTDITYINAGAVSTCMVADGSLMCSGSNSYHKLGIKDWTDVRYPTRPTATLLSTKDIISVHVGVTTGHIVYSDNTIYAFGTNVHGTLGDGSASSNRIGDSIGDPIVKMKFNFTM